MAALETAQARQAALLLHGLRPNDRQQVMAKLHVDESRRVQRLLDELVDIGVPPSAGRRATQKLLQDGHISASRDQELEVRVAALDAGVIAECFQNCDPRVVAHFLRFKKWPWSEKVLASMSNRIEIQNALKAGSIPLGPAVQRCLLERLCMEVRLRDRNSIARFIAGYWKSVSRSLVGRSSQWTD